MKTLKFCQTQTLLLEGQTHPRLLDLETRGTRLGRLLPSARRPGQRQAPSASQRTRRSRGPSSLRGHRAPPGTLPARTVRAQGWLHRELGDLRGVGAGEEEMWCPVRVQPSPLCDGELQGCWQHLSLTRRKCPETKTTCSLPCPWASHTAGA